MRLVYLRCFLCSCIRTSERVAQAIQILAAGRSHGSQSEGFRSLVPGFSLENSFDNPLESRGIYLFLLHVTVTRVPELSISAKCCDNPLVSAAMKNAILFSFVLITAGCGKNHSEQPNPQTNKPRVPTAQTKEKPQAVKPPVAADLATYTKGIPGEGQLMATIETSMGTLQCALFEDKTPLTVANFVGLARGLHAWRHPQTGEVHKKPYYDGVIFHRVIPGFMIQTGDPIGRGTGGPGYEFDDEFHPSLKHDRGGLLSMAHPARPNSNGGQFFITEKATPWLDNKHTVFGACDGVDLIKKIARVEKDPRDPSRSRPKDTITLKKVTIQRGTK